MNKKYTVIRKEHTYKDKLYEYTVPQLPELEAYTNFDSKIVQAVWYVKYRNSCKLEQTNCRSAIVNILFKQWYIKRQYDLIYNDENAGYMRFEPINLFMAKEKVVFYDKTYYIEQGNTFVIRPFKHYKWSIETDSGKTIAIIETGYYTNRYEIEVLDDELDITIIVVMVMMSDIRSFSTVIDPSPW